MPAHGLNKQTVTISNADVYGAGWTLTDAGQLTTEGMTGYVSSTLYAVIQPIKEKRNVEDGGTQTSGRYKAWLYKSGGTWPTVRGGPDLAGDELPTLVQWDGSYYEVQSVKEWKHGLLPHIFVELELLALERDAQEELDYTAPGQPTDTLVA